MHDDDAASWIALLESELRERRMLAVQTERLGRIGTWDLDLVTNELSWSDGTYRMFGLDPRHPVTLAQAISFYPEASRAALDAAFAHAIASGEPYDLTVQCLMPDGAEPWIRSIGQTETTRHGSQRMIGVVRDVTVEHEAGLRLRHLAEHDPLTGLCNRRMLMQALEDGAAADQPGLALLLLDLDRFKEVNDLHGHGVGDALLVEVATRLRHGVRSGDMVARLGGDEFAVILFGLADTDAVRRRVESLLAAFETPATLSAGPIRIGVSMGAAVFPEAGRTAGDLLRNADIALYQAKARGRNQGCVFDRSMRAALEERQRLLVEIRLALARGELEVFYQPVIDILDATVRSMEALVRWRHPTRGLLAPAAFQDALDDAAVSAEIGSFVLATSLGKLRDWIDAGIAPARVNVNVSEGQLQCGDALFQEVTELLEAHRLAPDRLKIEILEGAFLGAQNGAVAAIIARFQAHGIPVALDDFGTGHASLTHLKHFGIRHLKIDRSFSRGLGTDPDDTAICKAMTDLGRNLRIRVTAEGIETMPQLAELVRLRCDSVQGYLVSRPMPADAVPAFLTDWAATGPAMIEAARMMAVSEP